MYYLHVHYVLSLTGFITGIHCFIDYILFLFQCPECVMLARKRMKMTTKLLTTCVKMTLVSLPTYFIRPGVSKVKLRAPRGHEGMFQDISGTMRGNLTVGCVSFTRKCNERICIMIWISLLNFIFLIVWILTSKHM